MGADDHVYVPPGARPTREPAYSPEGVDLTLIRALLAKTPAERLDELQAFHRFLEGVRAANPGWTLADS